MYTTGLSPFSSVKWIFQYIYSNITMTTNRKWSIGFFLSIKSNQHRWFYLYFSFLCHVSLSQNSLSLTEYQRYRAKKRVFLFRPINEPIKLISLFQKFEVYFCCLLLGARFLFRLVLFFKYKIYKYSRATYYYFKMHRKKTIKMNL